MQAKPEHTKRLTPLHSEYILPSALFTIIRLGQKQLTMTNTPAYYEMALIMAVKRFIVQAPSDFTTCIFIPKFYLPKMKVII